MQRQITEDAARREIESMEKGRTIRSISSTSTIPNRSPGKPVTCAMSQDVEESSERCEGMMIQEVHAVPLKGERRVEESGRRVAQIFGFEAHVALRGQRIHMQHELKVLLRAAEKEK